MQLKNQVEWALHCCAILAGAPAGRYLGTKALAELHGVPKEYLSKALQALSRAGLVESTLGPAGGYRLSRSPAAISFWDVVAAVEGRGPAFVCTEIRGNNPCRPKGACDSAPLRDRPHHVGGRGGVARDAERREPRRPGRDAGTGSRSRPVEGHRRLGRRPQLGPPTRPLEPLRA